MSEAGQGVKCCNAVRTENNLGRGLPKESGYQDYRDLHSGERLIC
jgi:hypothetical protein